MDSDSEETVSNVSDLDQLRKGFAILIGPYSMSHTLSNQSEDFFC